MKTLKKLLAVVLALCILFSLSLSAFAAEESTSGYLAWELDESGTLHISGRGKLAPFTSADDQPWASLREEIVAVRLDPGAYMIIPDAAYWFSGCVNLEFCELPSFTDLGTDAFKDCGSLEILMLYYHDEAFRIADSAFAGVDADGLVILTDDIVTQTALEQRGFTVVSAYDSSMLAGNCGISGCTCSSCSWSYSYAPKDASTHYIWEVCNNCSANEYAYRHTGSHSFNSSGVCTLCGYAQAQSCSHSSTQRIWSGCDWEDVCRNCGETVNWGTTHGSYTYGSWTYYTISQHRRYGTCNDCGGGGKYQYGSHSTTAQYSQYNDTHHHVTQYCSVCASSVGSATTQAHSLSYGSWAKDSASQHKRTANCSLCGYSGYEYGDHSYTYGAWTSADANQHKRTKSCSVCGDSTYEYGNHADANADGKCDTCGYAMSATLTWDCGDGRTETTSQPYNVKLILPTEPAKDGYTFSGWFTAVMGGERVDGETVFTVDSPKTYYAQWAKIEVFSVTVPVSLPLIVDENGAVHTASAEIVNNSTGAVKVSGLTLTAKNGWQLVPFSTDMAHAKVDAKQIGFQINGAQTAKTGSEETFSFRSPWTIPAAGTLPIDYSAVVSAVSQPVTNTNILCVLFVIEWA